MYKKVIASLLSCVMLISISPAVAAEDAPVKPSIEEILNDFHQKAFAAEAATERGASTTYSCNSSSDNNALVQETVDTLNAAGYEAYHVTSSNYELLAAELKTDFENMGLKPDGSYILVIGSENGTNSSNPNSRVGNRPSYDLVDPGDSTNIIRYTYEGVEYKLRRIYLTTTNETDLFVKSDLYFSTIRDYSDYVINFVDTTVCVGIDTAADKYIPGLPLSSILKLMVKWAIDGNDYDVSLLDPDDIVMRTATCWTRDYLQVKNTINDTWYTAHYVSYAVSKAHCEGSYIYNPYINEPERILGNECSTTTYSPCYDDMERRKSNAVQAFLGGYTNYCCTGDIEFYFVDDTGSVNFGSDLDPLLIHKEPLADYIPRTDYD